MAVFQPGVSLHDGNQLRPQDLNDLLDLATVSGLGYTNFAGGTAACFIVGNTAPPIRRGLFWYDTTAGAEGLKYAFVSASGASIQKWLYLTPRREMICWTDSAVSMGYPMYLARGNGAFYQTFPNPTGLNGRIYDGIFFPSAWYSQDQSLSNPLLVIPTESAGVSQPIVCAWAGFVQGVIGNNPINAGNPFWTDLLAMGQFKDTTFSARSQTWGIQHLSTGANVSTAPATVWGAGPAYEDLA